MRIQGSDSPLEGMYWTFAAILPAPAVKADPAGLTPPVQADRGGAKPVGVERRMSVLWDFGDGSEPVEVEEHTSVSHVWADDGEYTITATARDERGTVARATHRVTVRNRRPQRARLAAVQTDRATQTVEFTASAVDVPGDTLTYRWSFGDGATDEGPELWRVEHRYPRPGEYMATVAFDDGDGGEVSDTVEIVVRGGVAETAGLPDELGDDDVVEAIAPGFRGDLSGGLSASFEGGVRSFAGLILNPVREGVCRLTYTSWDDSLLGYVMAIIDLRGIPGSGARYAIDGGWLRLVLEDEAGDYTTQRDESGLGMANRLGLGGLVGARSGGALDALPEADRARIIDTLGIDPRRPERSEAPRPMPARSPFGLEEGEGFVSDGGTLELTVVPGDGITGTYDVTLRNTSTEPPPGLATARMQGTFALDLRAIRREGMVNFGGCAPAELEIVSNYPDDGEEHFNSLRPPVRVSFDRYVDPATLDGDRLQIAYPSLPDGEMVPVPVRILRDRRRVWLVPETDLHPGVRYTVRVRTGDEGVRGRNRAKLPDPDGSGWWSSTFATRVDLVPGGDAAAASLVCDMFQTIRHPRLIAGKPALTRVEARWTAPKGVHPSAHVTDFAANVKVSSGGDLLATTAHRFVRPDLWDARGIDRRRAEHTAEVYGVNPDPAHGSYVVSLEVETNPGEWWNRYGARCGADHWDLAPVVTVDVFALPIGLWSDDPDEFAATLPALERIVAEARAYAEQVFPVAEFRVRGPQVLELDTEQRPPAWCDAACLGLSLKTDLQSASVADIVVALAPHDLRAADDPTREERWEGIGGGNVREDAALEQGQGIVVSLASRAAAYGPRYVNAMVHEIGHTLGLSHIPRVTESERTRASALRGGSDPLVYGGIEGFRLTPAGDAGWNKSSTEGNAEGTSLVPLMFPTTIPTGEAFIANHHYREVQRLFERLGWSRNR